MSIQFRDISHKNVKTFFLGWYEIIKPFFCLGDMRVYNSSFYIGLMPLLDHDLWGAIDFIIFVLKIDHDTTCRDILILGKNCLFRIHNCDVLYHLKNSTYWY